MSDIKTTKPTDTYIVFSGYDDFCITSYDNYYARIYNARAIMHLPKTLQTQNDIINYCEEYLNIQEHNIIFK